MHTAHEGKRARVQGSIVALLGHLVAERAKGKRAKKKKAARRAVLSDSERYNHFLLQRSAAAGRTIPV